MRTHPTGHAGRCLRALLLAAAIVAAVPACTMAAATAGDRVARALAAERYYGGAPAAGATGATHPFERYFASFDPPRPQVPAPGPDDETADVDWTPIGVGAGIALMVAVAGLAVYPEVRRHRMAA